MCYIYIYTGGGVVVTLLEPVMPVDEGQTMLPVCVDFLGSNLDRTVIVTLTTTNTGSAQGNYGPYLTIYRIWRYNTHVYYNYTPHSVITNQSNGVCICCIYTSQQYKFLLLGSGQ